MASILNAKISGGAPSVVVQNSPNAQLYLRDVNARDSKTLVQSAGKSLKGAILEGEWFSHAAASAGAAQSLGLEIKVAPEYHSNDFSTWANVADFSDDGTGDYSVRLQKAIDSGAQTIVMPQSGSKKYKSQVVVRANVRRIIGFWQQSTVAKDATFAASRNPMLSNSDSKETLLDPKSFFLRIEDGAGEPLIIEQFHHFPGPILNESSRTVVLRQMGVSAYANTAKGTGDLFTEGAMGARWSIGYGQKAWFRSTDCVFGMGPDISVDGATAWILSNRTEGGGVFVEAINGARVEIINSSQFIGSKGVGQNVAYVVKDADFSIVNFSELGFVKDGVYQTLLSETRDGRTTTIGRKSAGVSKRRNLNQMMFYRSSSAR